ncbi:MAG: c-type cytochrome [Candidatus Sericytochromatia bacterium]|nr:c-type cytochrome [Candidatus Sericytochromatia bacterium]
MADNTPHDPHVRRMDEILNEPVLDHEYDGIEELDNPLPGWWLMTFYGAIAFAVVYFTVHSIIGDNRLAERDYQQQWAAIEAQQAEQLAAQKAGLDPEALAAEVVSMAAAGKPIYDSRCAACHGGAGEGLIGPNLTDDSWIHGDGTAVPVYEVIRDGVNANGMPPWGALLSEDELKQVTGYVLSLQGSNPPNAKAPQGNKVN